MISDDLSRAMWRKSSYSHVNSDCVEVAEVGHAVAVRDSKDSEGPKLFVSFRGWANLLGAVKSGAHDFS